MTKQNKKYQSGFTCGSFDLLHAGHVLMLEEAKKYCERLIVGLQSDPTIDRPDKNKPVQSIEERLIQLKGCRYVDEVVIYDTEVDLFKLLVKLTNDKKIDVRIIGADWEGKKFTGHELEIPVIFNSRDHLYSTTELRQRILNQQAKT